MYTSKIFNKKTLRNSSDTVKTDKKCQVINHATNSLQ